jgi:cytochrome bd-type quinol oxidase subunit 2
MTTRQLAALQWFGLLAGALAWAVQHVVGFGLTQATCSIGGRGWNISHDFWQGLLMGVTAVVILVSLGAAVLVLRRTEGVTYEDAPPEGRIRFFAIAAIPINVLVLMIVLLDGTAAIVNQTCRQA